MKEQKNLPVSKHRKRRKHRLWLRALPHVVLIAGCLAIIVSITGSVFGKEIIPDEIVSNEMISGEAIPGSPVVETDDFQVDTEQTEIQTMDTGVRRWMNESMSRSWKC